MGWSLATRRPERCAVTCPTDRVVSVSTERVVTVVVAVWLVVSIITESTSTNTIPVISVKSVCDTSIKQNPIYCNSINIEKLWSLVSEEDRKAAAANTATAPVIDVTKRGFFKVLGKGRLPAQPVI